jgi:hypothetical protein
MFIEPHVRGGDKLLVELFFLGALLVAAHEEDTSSLGIKGKRHSPCLLADLEPKLLHVGVLRILQSVGSWPAKVRTKLLEHKGHCLRFCPARLPITHLLQWQTPHGIPLSSRSYKNPRVLFVVICPVSKVGWEVWTLYNLDAI